jgi:hypothetical protein
MKLKITKSNQILFFVLLAVASLAASGLTALAATEKLQGGQYLFTPAATQGNLAPSQDQTAPRYVDVNFTLLDNAVEGDAIGLNLYDDVIFTAILERKEPAQPDGYAWVGSLQGVEYSQVILAVGGGQMAGNITSPLGQYQVRFAGDGVHAVYTIDQSSFPDELPPIPVDADFGAGPNLAAVADLCTSIDVMVVWTQNAENAAGGATAMRNLVNLAVTETNQSYANSQMTQRINLAWSQKVAYTESGDFGTDLDRLRNPSDGYIDNVHTLRNTYYADLVSMFIEGTQYCGIGYMMSTVSPSFESNAFTVVARNCATGYYSFAHEMGHNEGARHDWYVDSGTTPYPYAHGYVNTTDRWRTIMAYNNECSGSGFNCARLQYWSNPNVFYGGDPMGVPSGSYHPADNHQTLNNTCSTVANFRDRPDAPAAFNKTSPANGATGASTSTTLSWQSSSGATSYAYCYDTSNNSTCNASWISTGANTSASLSGLSAGTTYYWHVRATNSNGTTYSNSNTWWSFTTTGAVPGPILVDHFVLRDNSTGNSIGNGNGAADCGETIELLAYLRNNGSATANSVSAAISTPSTYVSWPFNTSSSYGSIASGAVVINNDDFDFTISPNTPDGSLLHFDLNISATNGGPWTDQFDVPVTCRPDIAVKPAAFGFYIQPNSSASASLGIKNVGGALNWRIIVGVNPSIVGQWNMHYDWDCAGTPLTVVLTFNSNQTFVSSSGVSGTWSMDGSFIKWVYTNGTTYQGWVAGEYMAGNVVSYSGATGCWNADRVYADLVPLVSGAMTDSGEPAGQPGAETLCIPQDAGKIQKVTIDPGTIPSPMSGFDQTTGMQATNAPHSDLSSAAALAGGGQVLWDLTHGVLLGYEPANYYTSLVTLLNGAGFTISTTNAGVNNINLSAYNILVVNLGSNWNDVYSATEVDAIKAFVFNGGGLLIMSDNPACPNANLLPVSQFFGSTSGVSYLSNVISNLLPHPTFAGVSQIQYNSGGEVTVAAPASLVAIDPGSKGAVSVASFGGGKVLVIGDINLWENGNLTNANNQQFALNAFNWLARWLTASPTSGLTLPGGTSMVTVSVDSTGLGYGSYFGGLAILSNAYPPGKTPLIVPVTLVVTNNRIVLPIAYK